MLSSSNILIRKWPLTLIKISFLLALSNPRKCSINIYSVSFTEYFLSWLRKQKKNKNFSHSFQPFFPPLLMLCWIFLMEKREWKWTLRREIINIYCITFHSPFLLFELRFFVLFAKWLWKNKEIRMKNLIKFWT